MIEHRGTVVLETERLILRKFKMSDTEKVYKNWGSDSKVTEFLRWKTYESVEDAKKIIKIWETEYEKENFYHWAIELKELGEPIGSITVVEENSKIKKAHIGYCIGRIWWNKGITTEAFKEVIKFLFEEVGYNRIESQYDPNNIGSGAVMKKCGLKYEGTFRKADFNNKGIVDASMYAILKEDWEKME